MSFQLYVIDNTLNNTIEATLRREEKKNQMFEYFVFVMNKKIKKRKNVLKNVSSLLQNKRKISYYIYSVCHLGTKYNRKVSYLDSRNQIFMADINRYSVEEQLCY